MKDYGAIRFIFEGDRERAQLYTQTARKLAAIDSIVHQGQQVSDLVRNIDKDVVCHIQQRFGQIQATIFAPVADGPRLRREDIVGTLDLVFVVDVTGSFANVRGAVQSAMAEVFRQLKEAKVAVRTGAVYFSDFPIDPWGFPPGNDRGYPPDVPYRLSKALDDNHQATINSVLYGMPSLSGRDWLTSVLYALTRTSKEAGWLGLGAQVIFLSTDVEFRGPSPADPVTTYNYPGPTYADTVSDLKRRRIKVYNYGPHYDDVASIRQIVADTGGGTFEHHASPEEIVEHLLPVAVTHYFPE